MSTRVYLIITLSVLMCFNVKAQQLINGDFENNSVSSDQINLTNPLFNSYMENSMAFGSFGNVDIITSSTWGGGGAQNGDWYISITGGGTDQVSMELDAEMISGNTYSVSFWDRGDATYNNYPVQIGLSTDPEEFGEIIYTAESAPIDNVWTERVFSFTAPINGLYMTVQQSDGMTGDWLHVDNFEVLCDLSVDLGEDVLSCADDPVILDATTPDVTYEWQDGSTEATLSVTESGTYSVSIQSEACTVSDQVNVTIIDYPEIELTESVTVCIDEEVQLTASSDFILADYLWSTGDSTSSIVVDESGLYTVEVTAGGICTSEAQVEVIHVPYPEVDLGEDLQLCEGECVVLMPSYSSLNYEWQDGSNDSEILVCTPGEYWVFVDNEYCTSYDEITIEYELCDFELIMPNVFTPTGDDFNETWVPILAKNVFQVDCKVFNRWGNLVFEFKGENLHWNGEDLNGNQCAPGTYYYLIEYENQISESKELQGYIQVIYE